ncbi:MAG: radical SAM protein, partial [Actinomycetia bacterium]|nr:radical SAM protein [Actinomycetes bacterium]
AYTYNEPFIWYEYVLEVSKLIKENGLKNVLVTNGYVNEEPLKKLLPFIDALNIDIKSIKDKTYRKLKGSLDPVLETAKISKETCHVEITTLIVPTVNDRDDELVELFEWIADNLGKDTPLHLSRYFPVFKSDIPPTPVKTLQKAKKLALERLDRVSLGNI